MLRSLSPWSGLGIYPRLLFKHLFLLRSYGPPVCRRVCFLDFELKNPFSGATRIAWCWRPALVVWVLLRANLHLCVFVCVMCLTRRKAYSFWRQCFRWHSLLEFIQSQVPWATKDPVLSPTHPKRNKTQRRERPISDGKGLESNLELLLFCFILFTHLP